MRKIVLEDLILKAKRRMLKRILEEITLRAEQLGEDDVYEEVNTDFVLSHLIDLPDAGDCEDFWGTEGWQENFGI